MASKTSRRASRSRVPSFSVGLKKRTTFLFLVTLSCWPFAHHAMVRTWNMDQWRFFGFAMYTAPKSRVRVLDVKVDWSGESDIGPAEERAFRRLVRQLARGRQTLGRLYDWRATIREMFTLLPGDVKSVSISMSKSYLDGDAMLRTRPLDMGCRRSPGAEELDCSQRE